MRKLIILLLLMTAYAVNGQYRMRTLNVDTIYFGTKKIDKDSLWTKNDTNLFLATKGDLLNAGGGGTIQLANLSIRAKDEGTSSGNARGVSSVDLQTSKFSSTQVASGDYSVIGGGQGNTASGIVSSINGGGANVTSGSYASINGGSGNRATADFAYIGGGSINEASGYFSSVSGGATNKAMGTSSSIGGGSGNKAHDNGEHVVGVYNSISTGNMTAISPTNILFNVGNGTEDAIRSSAFKVRGDGLLWIKDHWVDFDTVGSGGGGSGDLSTYWDTTETISVIADSLKDKADTNFVKIKIAEIPEPDSTYKTLEVTDTFKFKGAVLSDTKSLKTAIELKEFDSLSVKKIKSPNDTLTLDAIVVTTDALYVGGRFIHEPYELAAYVIPDSNLTTSATTTWQFLGAGSSNKFLNTYAEGFSFDVDTPYFVQMPNDPRDSVEFHLNYGSQTSTGGTGVNAFYGVFTKRIGWSDYREYEPATWDADMKVNGDHYIISMPTYPIYLVDGEKIQIRTKVASGTETINTDRFSIKLTEE